MYFSLRRLRPSLPNDSSKAAQRVVIGHVLVFEQRLRRPPEVEDHHVVAAYRLEPLEAVVGPLDRLGERFLGLREGHRVVYEGERQRRVGHLRSVSHLAHVEIVADEQLSAPSTRWG